MKTTIISIVIGVIVIVGGLWYAYKVSNGPGEYDSFAQCIKDSGTKFYGAFWCPHCQKQKKLFKKSVKLLPYIECSTADGKNQTQACKDAGVESYPTWVFPDNSRLTGELSFKQLAEKSNCPLPVTTQ